MSENQPKMDRPLPRFKPSLSAGRKPGKSMTPSLSMPNLASKAKKPKKEVVTPQRKVREKTLLDLGPTVAPTHKFSESFNKIPKKNLDTIDSRMDDIIQNEGELAATLPLASSNSSTSASDILAPALADKIMLVQLPSSLPIQYPNDSIQMEYNPLFSAADGHIGKLYVHQSGKVTAKIGNIVLDVSSGISPSCSTLMCVKREKGIDYFPVPGQKIKLAVDIESLINSK